MICDSWGIAVFYKSETVRQSDAKAMNYRRKPLTNMIKQKNMNINKCR